MLRGGNGHDDFINAVLSGVLFHLVCAQHHRHTADAGIPLTGVIVHSKHGGTVAIPAGEQIPQYLGSCPSGTHHHHPACMLLVKPQPGMTGLPGNAEAEATGANHKGGQQPLNQINRARHQKNVNFPVQGVGSQRDQIGYPRADERARNHLHQSINAGVAQQISVQPHGKQSTYGSQRQHRRNVQHMNQVCFRGMHVTVNLQCHDHG